MKGLEALKRLEQSCYTIDPNLHTTIEKELKALGIMREYIFIDKLNKIRRQPVIKLKGGNFNCLGKEQYDLLKEVLKNE